MIFYVNDVSDLDSDDMQETRSIGGGAKRSHGGITKKTTYAEQRSADFKQLQPDPRQGNIRICLV